MHHGKQFTLDAADAADTEDEQPPAAVDDEYYEENDDIASDVLSPAVRAQLMKPPSLTCCTAVRTTQYPTTQKIFYFKDAQKYFKQIFANGIIFC